MLGSTGTDTISGVYGSTDGGKTWKLLHHPAFGPSWYCNTLAVSPTNASLIIGGGADPFLSTDGGATWTQEPGAIHPDQHAVVFSKDGSIVYLGNDGGVTSTTAISNPVAAWTTLNATLGVTQFYPGMSVAATDLNVSIGGTQDNGTLLYNGSLVWNWMQCGDGGATAIDPTNARNIYAACITGPVIAKSTDGGATNQGMIQGIETGEGFPWPPSLAMDPSNPSVLYYTGKVHIYQTTDGAATWQKISGDVTGGKGAPSVIAVAPSDSNTVYVGTQGGVVQVTRNAMSGSGATWTDVTAGLPQRYVTSMAVDPANPNLAYVTLSGFHSGHVFVTPNAGATWVDVSGNLPDTPVNDLAIDPDLYGTLYAATDSGVFVTTNGGVNWQTLGTELPNAIVINIRFHSATRTLRVSTHGRGMWDLPVPLPGLALTPGGVVNAASYGQTSGTTNIDTAVSPGSIAAVFGSSLTNVRQAFAANTPLPPSLGGETLTIAGLAAPQFYASSDQLNVQIPWEAPIGTATAVLTQGAQSTSSPVQVVAYLPGIFTADASGKGQGIIVHANSATLVAPKGAYGSSYPAPTGETLTLYATGLGPVSNPPATGAAASPDTLSQTTSTPKVTVGGQPAHVTFSGLTPGYVGLYQVNFEVPASAPAGDYVPVVLQIGGATSNLVTMAMSIPEIKEPAAGFPQSCQTPLAVPFPVLISGSLAANSQDCFSITLAQSTAVRFTLTGMDGFAGWLFLLNQDLSWQSYIYVTAGSPQTLDATLAAGTWTFNVGWNTDSAAGPYQLLVESPPPQ